MPRGKPRDGSKNPWGAPNEYDEKYIWLVDEYLEQCKDVVKIFHKTRWDKSDSYERYIKAKLPTIEWYALFVKRNKTTIYKWKQEQSLFSNALEKINAEQRERLLNNGLDWTYNTNIAKMLLSANHWLHEKSEVDQKISGEVTVKNVTEKQKQAIESLKKMK